MQSPPGLKSMRWPSSIQPDISLRLTPSTPTVSLSLRPASAAFSTRTSAIETSSQCVRNGANISLLEFQTHCDITPALFDSTGLSVAYSVPIFDAKGEEKIGVISARLRFDRLSSFIQNRVVAGGAAQVFFVTDAGEYFSETINAGTEPPPIPVTELRDIVRPLIGRSTSQVFTRRADKYLAVFPLE